MAEKLSWTELRRILAVRTGMSEKKAGVFLNAFQEQLSQALKTDKQVKINGLGTFKLQSVAPRKSVNVATGEDIVIDGYNKISFSSEAGLKELIERYSTIAEQQKDRQQDEVQDQHQPAAQPATEEQVIDPLKKLGEQAVEIVDILGELGQSPKFTEQVPEIPEESPEIPEESPETPEESPETPEESPEIPEESPDPETPEQPVFVPLPIPDPIPQPAPKPKNHFLRDTLICVALLLVLLFAGFYFLRQQLSSIIDSFVQPAPPQTEITESRESRDPEVITDTLAIPEDTLAIPESGDPEIPTTSPEIPAVTPQKPAITLKPSDRYPDLITIEEMHEASRLTWMAKRYYGHKKYWPYLYDANRDVIKNPGMIQVGTPIRVPKLTKQQLDTTNEQTAAYLEQLRLEAEEACKK